MIICYKNIFPENFTNCFKARSIFFVKKGRGDFGAKLFLVNFTAKF
jgi:hypothetical protein